jgi:hypothetical protein
MGQALAWSGRPSWVYGHMGDMEQVLAWLLELIQGCRRVCEEFVRLRLNGRLLGMVSN